MPRKTRSWLIDITREEVEALIAHHCSVEDFLVAECRDVEAGERRDRVARLKALLKQPRFAITTTTRT